MEEDRISKLPDEILIAILSLLSITEASRTCVISKRWRYLWTLVTCLNFDDLNHALEKWRQLAGVEDQYFVSKVFMDNWVNKVLQLHQGPTLNRFKIISCYYSLDHIENWMEFAIRKRVQRLEMEGIDLFKMLPEKPFRSPFGVSCIKSLKHLSLKYINISQELVGHIVSHCELVEHLCIVGSRSLFALELVGSAALRLKFLQISNCLKLVKVDIFAPNLVCFIYDGTGVYGRGIVLKGAASLVKVSLAESSDCITKPFLAISSCFSQLQTLSLCMDFDSTNTKLPKFPELTSLKDLSLTISNADNGQSLLDLTPLIEQSPFLHRLTVELKWKRAQALPISENNKIRACPHKCLKVVKISGFVGNVDTEFAMYLIKNAVVLEKLILDLQEVEIPPLIYILKEFESITKMRVEEARTLALQLGKQLPPGAELVII